ncbi:MAG: signal peptidase I [Candidatus Aenigmatarchaeota archaeon]
MENKEMTSTVIYVIAGVLLAFLINAGMGLALGTDLPIVAVQSNSMVPTFYKGDMLLLSGVGASDIRIGDIIVFSTEERNTPIVHRVIRVNEDGTLQTKGDANAGQLDFETKITHESIHGKVMYIIPYVGWVKIGLSEYALPFLVNNVVWVSVIVIVGLIIYYKFRGTV